MALHSGMFQTADLCDLHSNFLQVVTLQLKHYGKRSRVAGRITTVKVNEDNGLVAEALESAEGGSVVVVDGGGSLRCALLGERLARLIITKQLAGVIINGAIRDSNAINNLDVAVLALGTSPLPPANMGQGERNVTLEFANTIWKPGHYVYADADGIIVSESKLV